MRASLERLPGPARPNDVDATAAHTGTVLLPVPVPRVLPTACIRKEKEEVNSAQNSRAFCQRHRVKHPQAKRLVDIDPVQISCTSRVLFFTSFIIFFFLASTAHWRRQQRGGGGGKVSIL